MWLQANKHPTLSILFPSHNSYLGFIKPKAISLILSELFTIECFKRIVLFIYTSVYFLNNNVCIRNISNICKCHKWNKVGLFVCLLNPLTNYSNNECTYQFIIMIVFINTNINCCRMCFGTKNRNLLLSLITHLLIFFYC